MQDYKQFLHIRKTLLSIWNPIGFDDLPDDEYDSYAYQLLDMIGEGKPRTSLFHYLYHIEAEVIGLGQADKKRIQKTLDEILCPYPLAIFEFVYQSELAYLSIEDRALFLAESKPFKKFSQVDRDKVRQVCAKDYYLPANESEHDKLWQAMEYLDPILIFERNSEGPFLRVSLLLALMASYELSLEDFASLWMCNTKNRIMQEKRDGYRLCGML